MQASGTPNVDTEKLAKLQRMAAGVRTGGKGSVRRKKKAVHKAAPTDDKRLQSTLKRLQLNLLPGIEEVNIIRENGTFIHFKNPKVQAQVPANTYVVSGTAETKPLTEMMSNVMSGAPGGGGASEMAQVRAYMEQLRASGNLPKGMDYANIPGLGDLAADGTGANDQSAAGEGNVRGAANADDDDDDDVPDLVDNQNFDASSKPLAHDHANGDANSTNPE
jgi:nascent polypeptide-associated complex subunit beta